MDVSNLGVAIFDRTCLPRRDQRLTKNLAKLTRLVDQRPQLVIGQQPTFRGKAKPAARLAQFFQANTELMNEIGPTFRRSRFLIIRRWRSGAPYKLASDMAPHARSRQGVGRLSGPHREVQQPLGQVFAFDGRILPAFAFLLLHFAF